MNKPKVLITDYLHGSFEAGLEQMGFEVCCEPETSLAEVADSIANYTGLIVATRIKVNTEMIDCAEKLQFIGRAGSGMEFIDVDYARSKGIAVFNSPEGNCDAVAEHAMGMILSFNNHLFRTNRQVREGKWQREENRGTELKGKTLGIIGYGNTGQALARKLVGFDLNVIAFDKYKSGFSSESVAEVEMDTIYRYADVVSLHVPLTDETLHLCNAAFFNSFEKAILLVNTARGKVVDADAALSALKNGKLRGLCLDVLENEDLASMAAVEEKAFKELAGHENVVFSPHVAGWTYESKERIATVLLQKIQSAKKSVN